MAKAIFHKHQRVFVRPVGTWAIIEHVKPQWVKDVEEPVRVFYDCGLGRDFATEELAAEQVDTVETGQWRILRAKNKWQSMEDCARHPFPGTFPVVVTESMDWGGWRVPAAEYDRDPTRIEAQARLLSHCPQLLALTEHFAKLSAEYDELPEEFADLVKQSKDVLREINSKPACESVSESSRAA